jgi:gluconate 2-dehydrogenase
VPLTNETRQLIDQQELKQMKRNAILINGGRGPVLNQNALIKALKDHTILGAGLDVYEEEPLPYDSELLSLENVVLLPHIGSATEETRTQMAICAVDNFRQALLGVKPKNLLNPELL